MADRQLGFTLLFLSLLSTLLIGTVYADAGIIEYRPAPQSTHSVFAPSPDVHPTTTPPTSPAWSDVPGDAPTTPAGSPDNSDSAPSEGSDGDRSTPPDQGTPGGGLSQTPPPTTATSDTTAPTTRENDPSQTPADRSSTPASTDQFAESPSPGDDNTPTPTDLNLQGENSPSLSSQVMPRTGQSLTTLALSFSAIGLVGLLLLLGGLHLLEPPQPKP